jgi:outer membrane protein
MVRICSFIFLGICVAFQSMSQDTLKLSFQDAVKIGLENNVAIKQESNNLEVTMANRRQARAQYAPGFGAFMSGSKLNGQQFDQVTGSVYRDNTDLASINVGGRYVIFDGLNRLNSNRQTQSLLESQQFLVDRTEQDVIYNVGSQFLQVLMDKEILRINKINLEAQSTTLEQIRGFVEAGTRPLSDQLDQEATVSQIEVEVIRAENDLRIDMAIFTQTLMLEPGLEIDPIDPDWGLQSILVQNYDLDSLYGKALVYRPDYKKAIADQEAANATINMARSLHYPTLEFFGAWGSRYTSQAVDTDFGKQLFESNYVWNYGLELNIPIYQRHFAKTEKVKAKMAFENSKLVEKDLRLMIFREVQTAYLNFLASKNEYYAAEKQFNAAQEAYNIQKERYEVGVGTLVELSRSTWTLVDGAASRAQARYQLLFQKVILDYFTGLLNPEEL